MRSNTRSASLLLKRFFVSRGVILVACHSRPFFLLGPASSHTLFFLSRAVIPEACHSQILFSLPSKARNNTGSMGFFWSFFPQWRNALIDTGSASFPGPTFLAARHSRGYRERAIPPPCLFLGRFFAAQGEVWINTPSAWVPARGTRGKCPEQQAFVPDRWACSSSRHCRRLQGPPELVSPPPEGPGATDTVFRVLGLPRMRRRPVPLGSSLLEPCGAVSGPLLRESPGGPAAAWPSHRARGAVPHVPAAVAAAVPHPVEPHTGSMNRSRSMCNAAGTPQGHCGDTVGRTVPLPSQEVAWRAVEEAQHSLPPRDETRVLFLPSPPSSASQRVKHLLKRRAGALGTHRTIWAWSRSLRWHQCALPWPYMPRGKPRGDTWRGVSQGFCLLESQWNVPRTVHRLLSEESSGPNWCSPAQPVGETSWEGSPQE